MEFKLVCLGTQVIIHLLCDPAGWKSSEAGIEHGGCRAGVGCGGRGGRGGGMWAKGSQTAQSGICLA